MFRRFRSGSGLSYRIVSPAIADKARPSRSNDVGCIIRFMLSPNQLQFKALQEDTPDDLDLLVSERHPDTPVPAASKSNQPVRAFPVFLTPGAEAIGIIALRFMEDVRQAMRHRR